MILAKIVDVAYTLLTRAKFLILCKILFFANILIFAKIIISAKILIFGKFSNYRRQPFHPPLSPPHKQRHISIQRLKNHLFLLSD